MNLRVLALVVLVVGAVPAATAAVPSPADATALNDRDVSSVQETASEETETDDSESEESDYTNLYVESEYDYPDLKPGESTEFTVTVKNGEDSEVDLDPHVSVPPIGENLLNESWVTIEGDSTVAANGETEFTVTVSVPEDAKIGHYRGQIAFTDETVTYPGRPERPVHAASLNVRVWKQPTVNIVSSTYIHGQVEAGDSATKQIVVENTGEQAVPLSPQFGDDRNRRYGGRSSQIDPAWVDIDAPSSIDPGETATVSVTVSPPEDADSQRYRGTLDLGLKDPNRADENNYWQEISMNFEVWNQPEEAFETSFEVSEDAQNVTLTLSPRAGMRGSGSDDPANFEVTFVKPDGTTVTAERVQVTDRGTVDLRESNDPSVTQQGEYGVRSGGQEFVYRIDDPDAGSWDLRVMPENVIGFSYEIVRNESAE
jgi:hypothetical protein